MTTSILSTAPLSLHLNVEPTGLSQKIHNLIKAVKRIVLSFFQFVCSCLFGEVKPRISKKLESTTTFSQPLSSTPSEPNPTFDKLGSAPSSSDSQPNSSSPSMGILPAPRLSSTAGETMDRSPLTAESAPTSPSPQFVPLTPEQRDLLVAKVTKDWNDEELTEYTCCDPSPPQSFTHPDFPGIIIQIGDSKRLQQRFESLKKAQGFVEQYRLFNCIIPHMELVLAQNVREPSILIMQKFNGLSMDKAMGQFSSKLPDSKREEWLSKSIKDVAALIALSGWFNPESTKLFIEEKGIGLIDCQAVDPPHQSKGGGIFRFIAQMPERFHQHIFDIAEEHKALTPQFRDLIRQAFQTILPSTLSEQKGPSPELNSTTTSEDPAPSATKSKPSDLICISIPLKMERDLPPPQSPLLSHEELCSLINERKKDWDNGQVRDKPWVCCITPVEQAA